MCFAFGRTVAAGETNTEERLRLLQKQNDALQEQLRQQQELINTLNRDVAKIRQASEKRDAEVEQLKSDTKKKRKRARSHRIQSRKSRTQRRRRRRFLQQPVGGILSQWRIPCGRGQAVRRSAGLGRCVCFRRVESATRENDGSEREAGRTVSGFRKCLETLGTRPAVEHARGAHGHSVRRGILPARRDRQPAHFPFALGFVGRGRGHRALRRDRANSVTWWPCKTAASPARSDYQLRQIRGRPAVLRPDALAASERERHAHRRSRRRNDYWSELWFGNGWFGSLGSTTTTQFTRIWWRATW